MLSLANVNPSMALDYFENDDYYCEATNEEVEISGKAKAHLNLKDKIDRTSFANLLYGYSPDGNTKLVFTKKTTLSEKEIEV